MKREKDVCPICGSVAVDEPCRKPVGVLCPKCRCKSVACLVRERDHELAVVDYHCRRCHFKWSDWRVLPVEIKVGHCFWDVYEGCEACLKGRGGCP
jgi:hypothetical protein